MSYPQASSAKAHWIRARQVMFESSYDWAVDVIQRCAREYLARKRLAQRGREKAKLERQSSKRKRREGSNGNLRVRRSSRSWLNGSSAEDAQPSIPQTPTRMPIISERKRNFWTKVRAAHRWRSAASNALGMRRKIDMLLGRRKEEMNNMRKLAEEALAEQKVKTELAEDEKDKVCYTAQGNDEYYSDENLQLRYTLMQSERVQQAVGWWFALVCGDVKQGPYGSGRVSKKAYKTMAIKIQLALVPDVTYEEAEACADDDWEDDSKGEDTMGWEEFFASLFQLVDLWTDSVEENDYVEFLDTTLATVAHFPPKPPTEWRTDDEILGRPSKGGYGGWRYSGCGATGGYVTGLGGPSGELGEETHPDGTRFGAGVAGSGTGADTGPRDAPAGKATLSREKRAGFGSSVSRFTAADKVEGKVPVQAFKAAPYKPAETKLPPVTRRHSLPSTLDLDVSSSIAELKSRPGTPSPTVSPLVHARPASALARPATADAGTRSVKDAGSWLAKVPTPPPLARGAQEAGGRRKARKGSRQSKGATPPAVVSLPALPAPHQDRPFWVRRTINAFGYYGPTRQTAFAA